MNPAMKLCILDNDVLDPAAAPIWGSYAAMFERLLRGVGFEGEVDVFSARHGQYPASFAPYEAVLLTGSRADALRLRQILANFLSNAIKFTDKGHVHVSATMTIQSVVVTVQDTGIGINEANLPHIFDEFRQADRRKRDP